MGLIDKIKDFGSKIVRGFKGIGEKIRDKMHEKERMKEAGERMKDFMKNHPNGFKGPISGINPEIRYHMDEIKRLSGK
jgi:hypothetical protein